MRVRAWCGVALLACRPAATPMVVAAESHECAVVVRAPDGSTAPGVAEGPSIDVACAAAWQAGCEALGVVDCDVTSGYAEVARSTEARRSFVDAPPPVRRAWRRAVRTGEVELDGS
jgi:hypothetical protein